MESDLVQSMPPRYLKDFQQRISANSRLQGPRNRRLLVARKGPTRTIHNLDQVQAFLSRYDFETVYLEGLSMAEQIMLFQSAEFIISPHGAGLANLLFCEPGTKVIELMPSVELRPFFWMISEKLDLVHGMQFCMPAGDQNFQSAMRSMLASCKRSSVCWTRICNSSGAALRPAMDQAPAGRSRSKRPEYPRRSLSIFRR